MEITLKRALLLKPLLLTAVEVICHFVFIICLLYFSLLLVVKVFLWQGFHLYAWPVLTSALTLWAALVFFFLNFLEDFYSFRLFILALRHPDLRLTIGPLGVLAAICRSPSRWFSKRQLTLALIKKTDLDGATVRFDVYTNSVEVSKPECGVIHADVYKEGAPPYRFYIPISPDYRQQLFDHIHRFVSDSDFRVACQFERVVSGPQTSFQHCLERENREQESGLATTDREFLEVVELLNQLGAEVSSACRGTDQIEDFGRDRHSHYAYLELKEGKFPDDLLHLARQSGCHVEGKLLTLPHAPMRLRAALNLSFAEMLHEWRASRLTAAHRLPANDLGFPELSESTLISLTGDHEEQLFASGRQGYQEAGRGAIFIALTGFPGDLEEEFEQAWYAHAGSPVLERLNERDQALVQVYDPQTDVCVVFATAERLKLILWPLMKTALG